MTGSEYKNRLENAKAASMGQLLFKCSRLLNELGIARMREQTALPGLRTAHTALFPHIELEGVRPTVLAEKIGISKQAVGQLVGELEEMGVLVRAPDPEDRRAKLVCFTERGKRGLLEGLVVLGELESDLAQQIGRKRIRALHEALTALLPELEKLLHPKM